MRARPGSARNGGRVSSPHVAWRSLHACKWLAAATCPKPACSSLRPPLHEGPAPLIPMTARGPPCAAPLLPASSNPSSMLQQQYWCNLCSDLRCQGVEREIERTSRPTGAICVLIWDVEEHRGKLGRREAELVQFCALICWRGEIGRESCVPGVYLGAMKFFSWRWRKKLTEIGRWQAICSTKNVKRCRSPRKATPRGCRSSQDAATVRPATSAAWCKCCLELLCLPTGDGGVRTQRGQQEVEGDAGSWGTHGKFQNKWIVMVNLRTSKIIMVWTQLTLKNTDSTMPKTLKTGHIILSLHMTKIAYCTWKLPLSAY